MTSVWFLPGVGADMLLQVAWLFETFITPAASVQGNAAVYHTYLPDESAEWTVHYFWQKRGAAYWTMVDYSFIRINK